MKIIYKDGHVDECPQDQELHVIRHTAAHVMAQAIKRLYPQADFAFGPATENGFYYDVDLGDQKLSDEDLANIEKEMRKIVKENLPIKPFILPRAEAVKLMEERKENYKIEHMADLADETEFSFFQQGEYVDMCIGPHLTYTKALKAFKITQQSGAYWKNDKENKMLTRINGVAFHNQEELEAWEKEQQEARERDHRKIGKEMGLFMTDDLVGRGLPMFLPAGVVMETGRKVHRILVRHQPCLLHEGLVLLVEHVIHQPASQKAAGPHACGQEADVTRGDGGDVQQRDKPDVPRGSEQQLA